MILYCSFASASFTSRNPPSLSVDHLNCKKIMIWVFRASLIATPSWCLPQKWFMNKDPGLRLYRVSWLFLTGIVTSISCAFSSSSSLLQNLRNSSRRHSVLMLLSLSSATNLSLSFLNPPHPSVYHVVELLPYSDHSLHWLIVFVCWSVSKWSWCLRTSSADPRLITFYTPLFHVDFRSL